MKRRLWISLIGTIVAVVGALAFNLATDNKPILGLDLQGGLSVILAPEEGASEADLLVIRDLVRSSLERSGVAEPDVRVQGSNIVVDLPGVKDKEEALRSVSVSGIVELRPVVNLSDCSAPIVDPEITDDVEPNGFRRTAPEPEPETLCRRFPRCLQTVQSSCRHLTAAQCVSARRRPAVKCSSATAPRWRLVKSGGFSVNVELRSDGEAAWNSLATQCFNQLPTCPSTGIDANGASRPGQIAIVLDGVVQSAPVVNTPVFDGNVSITGSFSQEEAEQLADVLNRGAFPVQVTPQETRTVSASAGGDSLNAAIISGLIGLALVLIFLVFYYRLLALVIIGGLIIWGMTVYSAAAFVSGATNYALSLAGITGIIVAIGVTVDSYVVFFERMKDEIRNGRTLRNAAPRSFNSTWRTIWSADLVSVIGAVILFSLSVGSVRGFALYLGITTLCDLFVCFFFTRPAVLLLARSKFMVGKRAFGLEVAAS